MRLQDGARKGKQTKSNQSSDAEKDSLRTHGACREATKHSHKFARIEYADITQLCLLYEGTFRYLSGLVVVCLLPESSAPTSEGLAIRKGYSQSCMIYQHQVSLYIRDWVQ